MSYQPQPEVFTKQFKLKGSIVHAGLGLLLILGPLFGGLIAALFITNIYGDTAGGITALAALLLAGVGIYVSDQRVFLIFNSDLRRDLAAALHRRLGRNPDDGRAYFVGWAPGPSVNPKDMETDHDVGFLTLTPELMTFLGDIVAFELRRDQVLGVDCKQMGLRILLDLGCRVIVYWFDPYGQQNAFTLERREGRTRSQVKRNNRELAQVLEQWRLYGVVPP
jgi:hypothetical protein